MTSPDPVEASPRPHRDRWLLLGQALLCVVLGAAVLATVAGGRYSLSTAPAELQLAVAWWDLAFGTAANIGIALLRVLPEGRIRLFLHLTVLVLCGWAMSSLPALLIALYRLGTRRRIPIDATALAATIPGIIIATVLNATVTGTGIGMVEVFTGAASVALSGIPLLMGRIKATRMALLASLREEASSAEAARLAAEREAAALIRERDAAIDRIRADERAALARDVHDSVSHHLATIALHAGALALRDDLPPAVIHQTARTVRDAAHAANGELRDVLLTLRSQEGAEPLAEAATLADLVARARGRGQDVELLWHGLSPAELDAGSRGAVVALARILAEGLANAAKHAPHAPVWVTLRRDDDRLTLTVENPSTAAPAAMPSTGHGLVGVVERARLLGGDAEASEEDGRHRLRAWVPWT